MVEIYIKYKDNNYYLLDLDDSETVNYKLTVKDLNDITKIFSPFTQSFNIKATDKNKMLCGFVGNEKIQRLNNDGKFPAMIYISGFLFQSGVLSFDETSYTKKEQKSFKTNFASNLTGLNEKLGDSTIQDLFDLNENNIKIDWNKIAIKPLLKSIQSRTLSNGIALKYGVPFISNKRVWTYDPNNLGVVDNVAFKPTKNATDVNYIALDEVRPAVNYMAIMEHLLIKIGVPVIAPIFNTSDLTDLMVLCNNEDLISKKETGYNLNGWGVISYSRDAESGSYYPPAGKWLITYNAGDNSFKFKNRPDAYKPMYWGNGFDVDLYFNSLMPLGGTEKRIKVTMYNATTNIPIDSQEISNGVYSFRIIDNYNGASMLDSNGELRVRFEILPIDLVSWAYIKFQTLQAFRNTSTSPLSRAGYRATSTNLTSPSLLGGNKLNLIASLPEMKCTDFLKSFFKIFNISVISTGEQDGSMYWLTPDNIKEINKPYSKRIVDYTEYTDTETLTKKRGNDYNQYLFKHFDSKYYDSVYGDGTKFGSLIYPAITPAKANKFEVETSYSILKQGANFVHPSGARTAYGFTRDTPTTLTNGGNRYKSVFGEFTLMYLKGVPLGNNKLSLELNNLQNDSIDRVLEPSFKNSLTNKTLAFGAEGIDTDSLYLNYYSDFIELLLKPNTYKSEFTLTLPSNEIFLNFSNLAQNESNIPTGFRAQNEIIIGEQRYLLIDSSIDLTSGKTKLTLLNF